MKKTASFCFVILIAIMKKFCLLISLAASVFLFACDNKSADKTPSVSQGKNKTVLANVSPQEVETDISDIDLDESIFEALDASEFPEIIDENYPSKNAIWKHKFNFDSLENFHESFYDVEALFNDVPEKEAERIKYALLALAYNTYNNLEILPDLSGNYDEQNRAMSNMMFNVMQEFKGADIFQIVSTLEQRYPQNSMSVKNMQEFFGNEMRR